MTDDASARKPGRLWLLLPLVLLALAAAGWSGFWWWLSRETAERMDSAAAALTDSGYPLTWATRRIEGFPFRLTVTLTDARFASAGGRAISAPRVVAEATAYRPDRWVANFPAGLTLDRPLTGPTRIDGRVIRASVVSTPRGPRVGVEGRDLRFTPAGGPILFPLTSAGRFDLNYAPRPDGPDEAGLLIRIEDGVAAPGTLIQRIGVDPKTRLLWEAVLTEASSFRGEDWGAAVEAWTDAGGVMRVEQASAAVGDAAATVDSGQLTVGNDGRLRGALNLAVQQAPRSLLQLRGVPKVDPDAASRAAAVAQAREQAALARLRLVFEAGVVTVGPVALAPAPKIY
jgi:hypothetical protein